MFLHVRTQNGTNEILCAHKVSETPPGGAIETGNIDTAALNIPIQDQPNGIWWWDGPMVNGDTSGTIKVNYKKEKLTAINKKTGELIEYGFDWNATHYYLPEAVQPYYLALAGRANNGSDMTGYTVQDRNNARYSFTSTLDFWSWWDTGFARVQSVVEGGQQLRLDVHNAVNTQAAMDAIIDSRT